MDALPRFFGSLIILAFGYNVLTEKTDYLCASCFPINPFPQKRSKNDFFSKSYYLCPLRDITTFQLAPILIQPFPVEQYRHFAKPPLSSTAFCFSGIIGNSLFAQVINEGFQY